MHSTKTQAWGHGAARRVLPSTTPIARMVSLHMTSIPTGIALGRRNESLLVPSLHDHLASNVSNAAFESPPEQLDQNKPTDSIPT